MHDLTCDWQSGFVMDPSKKQRIGYLTGFEGLNMGEFLKADIEVFTPYSNGEVEYEGVEIDAESAKATVVGILDSFTFGGGVGDPLCISGYISAENAEILKAKTKGTLDTTMITKLGFWVCNFDEENKVWYEEAFPKEPVEMRGQLNAPGGKDVRLVVAAEPTKVHPNVDINVYNIYVEVIPAADDTFAIHFATSSKTKFVRNWGLKVGTNAAQAMGA